MCKRKGYIAWKLIIEHYLARPRYREEQLQSVLREPQRLDEDLGFFLILVDPVGAFISVESRVDSGIDRR